MNLTEFSNWLANPFGSRSIIYHTGLLMADRQSKDPAAPIISAVAGMALSAANRGIVTLVQRRLGEANYEYIAIRSQK